MGDSDPKLEGCDAAGKRILLGVREIAGYYSRLERGLLHHGVDCNRIDFYGQTFNYPAARPRSAVCRTVNALASWMGLRAGNIAERAARRAVITAMRVSIFPWAIWRHDAFVFGFGESLLPRHLDLPILRLLGRQIVFVFHGSDSRPPYLDRGAVFDPAGNRRTLSELARRTRRQSRKVRRIDRHAHWVIENPLAGHFHVRRYVNWFAMGMPVDLTVGKESRKQVSEDPDRAVRVLHSPSYPAAKGTFELRKIVEGLRKEDLAFDYIEVSGKPHAEVMAEVARSDFVIDQLYSDTPLAGFASEAAAHGRAAIVGIHEPERSREVFPGEVYDAVCEPAALTEKIRAFIRSPERRESAGARAGEFITQWSEEAVAARMIRLLTRGPKPSWMIAPGRHESLYGWGMPASVSREVIAEMVSTRGEKSLCLEANAAVRRALLERIKRPSGDGAASSTAAKPAESLARD